ncbi:MAG: hypothetical protein ACI8QC_003086 [Planctomycetota bacterium]|jgi:hypothetical protein
MHTRSLSVRTSLLAFVAIFLGLPVAAKDLHGGVRLIQPGGNVAYLADGFAMLRVRRADESQATEQRVAIKAGRWSLELAADAQFQIGVVRIEAGDCYAVDAERWLKIPPTGEFDLDVRVLRAFRLCVYGADGRSQLSQVSVLRKLSRDTRLPHPGPISGKTHVVSGPTNSPVDIRVSTPAIYTYYARAPGYAWSPIEVDPFLGGTRTLQLTPGGSLTVEIQQLGSLRGKVFRVRRQTEGGMQLHLELKRYASGLTVEGLPSGRYSISSEEPIRPVNMPVFGRADFTINAGESTHQQLILAEDAYFRPAPVGGELHVPEAWGDVANLTLVLDRLDRFSRLGRHYEVLGKDLVPVPTRPRVFTWRIAEAMPGAFDLHLPQLSVHSFYEVLGAGNLRLNLELPPPRQIELQLIDGSSGKPVSSSAVSWACRTPLRSQSPRSKLGNLPPYRCAPVALQESSPGRFSFRAPQADLVLRIDDPDFEPASLELDPKVTHPKPWRLRRRRR